MNLEKKLFLKHSLNQISEYKMDTSKTSCYGLSKSKNEFLAKIENNGVWDENLAKNIDYKERFFKIKKFMPHCKTKSMDIHFPPSMNKDARNFSRSKYFENNGVLPLPNKNNLLCVQNLKNTVYSQFPSLSKNGFNKSLHIISKFQKENEMIFQQFQKDKEKLGKIINSEKKRNIMIKEEKKEYFQGLENINKNFQALHFDPNDKTSKDATKFISYMEFQNSIKDKEYLVGKYKKEIDEQVSKIYKEYHEKRGRREMN